MNSAMTTVRNPAGDALRTRRQWLGFLAVGVTLGVAAHVLDHAAWSQLRDARVNDKDWGRLLRSMGYLPTWLIVAGGFWLHDRGSTGWGWRGGLVLLAPALSGGIAELLKIAIRRLRPDPDAFRYVWRPIAEDLWSTRGLGMPSSHVAVAFAGAAVLSRLLPKGWWLWYLLAVGCAVTRILALGHFLSDTVVAALLGYVVGAVLVQTGGFRRALSAAG